VKQICDRAREKGILTVVDAAHSPGQISVDLQALGADVVFGNCHKWMLAPKGAGFLYVRREIQPMIEPLIVSWGTHATEENTTGSRYIDLLQWTGTRDPAAYLAIPAAIRFMRENDWRTVQSNCHELLKSAILRICDLFGMPPLFPLDSAFYSQMGIAPIPNSKLVLLKTRLYDEYHVEVPLIQWQDRQFIRISVQAYNTQDDIEVLICALKELLPKTVAQPSLSDV
jgi:isopenicillin-N epimerase